MRYAAIGGALKTKAAEVVAYSHTLKDETQKDAERLDKILEDTKDSQSINEISNANNVLVHAQVQEAREQTRILNELAVILAQDAVLAQQDRERQSLGKGMYEDRDTSEGFLEMIGNDRGSNEFRGGANNNN